MREAGAGQMQVRGIRMGDRRQETAFGIGLLQIDGIAEAMRLDDGDKRLAAVGGFHRQRVDAACILNGLALRRPARERRR